MRVVRQRLFWCMGFWCGFDSGDAREAGTGVIARFWAMGPLG